MAINIENLQAYVDEQRTPLLRNAVVGSKTAGLFNLQTGIKGATALNLLETVVEFGDGSECGWNQAGESKLSQRTLEPGYIKVNMSFCDKKLLKTWMNYDVRVAAGQKTLPFEEDFMAGVIDGVKANLEKALWQGDKDSEDDNLNKFDGMIKVIGSATVASTITYADGDTVTSVVNRMTAAIPTRAYQRGEIVLYMGADKYRAYIQELIANGNIVITNTLNDIPFPDSILVPGTNVRVHGVAGLDGTDKMYASYKDNFVYGVDMQNDEEKLDFWYSQDNREFRLAIEFLSGVQVAYPDLVVKAEKEEQVVTPDEPVVDPDEPGE